MLIHISKYPKIKEGACVRKGVISSEESCKYGIDKQYWKGTVSHSDYPITNTKQQNT